MLFDVLVGRLQTAFLAARLVPVVSFVHAPGHPVVPTAMEGNPKAVGHGQGFLLRRKDPPGPIPLKVDEQQVVRVESAALKESLDVRLVGDELSEFARGSDRHRLSLGAGFGVAQIRCLPNFGSQAAGVMTP